MSETSLEERVVPGASMTEPRASSNQKSSAERRVIPSPFYEPAEACDELPDGLANYIPPT